MLKKFKFDEDAPPLSDPQWEGWCQPIYEFLAVSKSWGDLAKLQPRIKGSRLRQCLAWLEARHRATTYVDHDGEIMWMQSGGKRQQREARQPKRKDNHQLDPVPPEEGHADNPAEESL